MTDRSSLQAEVSPDTMIVLRMHRKSILLPLLHVFPGLEQRLQNSTYRSFVEAPKSVRRKVGVGSVVRRAMVYTHTFTPMLR